MDEVLDLSAKSKPDSGGEPTNRATSVPETSPRDVPPATNDDHPSSPSTTTTPENNRATPTTPVEMMRSFNNSPAQNISPGQIFMSNYQNYSLMANRYLAFQHQMMSLMANQMQSNLPWRLPLRPPNEDRTGDLFPFLPNFPLPQTRSLHFPRELLRSNYRDFPALSRNWEDVQLVRRSSSDQTINERRLANHHQTQAADQPPVKKSRLNESNSNSNESFPGIPFRDSSFHREPNKPRQAYLEECSSNDSRSERFLLLHSDHSTESQDSVKSGEDSIHGGHERQRQSRPAVEGNGNRNSFPGTSTSRHGLPRTSEESDVPGEDPGLIEYREKRRKNNAAAKKSRDQRRIQEESINQAAGELKQQNSSLKAQLFQLKARSAELERFLASRTREQPRLMP